MEFHLLSLLVIDLLIGMSLQHMNSPPPGVPPRQHHHQAPSQGQGLQPPPASGQNQDLHFQPHGGGGRFGHQDVHNKEHIKEHLKEVVDKPKEEMTDEELEFHYFKLHDYDGNNKLDGIEITKAITHFHEEQDHDENKQNKDAPKREPKIFTDPELTNIIDLVLKEDDFNNDGYIEYSEFVTAQRKNREAEAEEDRNEDRQKRQQS